MNDLHEKTAKNPDRNKVIIIAGPTASGKSDRAVALAREMNGAIINADSQQIYKGLPVLSAQPPPEDMAEIPHHLYSFMDGKKWCDAHFWKECALKTIEKVVSLGQTPIIAGGTGLYINALVDGLSPIPDIPQPVRDEAVRLLKDLGNEKFYDRLVRKDPIAAKTITPGNSKMMVRYWETVSHTGKSLAEWQKKPLEGPPGNLAFYMTVILPARKVLIARCEKRFDAMLASGAIEEVETVLDKIERGVLPKDTPVQNALGFKALSAYIRGQMSRDEAREKSVIQTRQYIKRQTTWFRHQKPANLACHTTEKDEILA